MIVNSENILWKATDNGIVLLIDNFEESIPAEDVIRIEFKGQTNYKNYSINQKPSKMLANIKINRFPVRLYFELNIPTFKNDKPVINICLKTDSNIEYVNNLPTSDQIIISNNWYPIVKDEVEELVEIYKITGINQIGEISMQQYLKLLQIKSQLIKITKKNTIERIGESENRNFFYENQELLYNYGFNGTLYEYQKSGVSWLISLAKEEIGCILADEMGLGKTVQIISLITIYKTIWNNPTLIITPATLLENWRREFIHFSPNLKILVHLGTQRTGFPSTIKSYDVIITSYDLAVRDQGLFNMIDFSFLILDEAQAIKNPETKRSLTVKGFKRKVSIAVTGTPVENRLRDLWSLMDFSCPGLLGNLSAFEKNIEDTTEDASNLELKVSPFILRRKVVDVAMDLPDKLIIPQAVMMDKQTVIKYNEIRQDIIAQYGDSATLVTLTKLRQFCAHPFLIEDCMNIKPELVSPKFQRLLEIIEEIQLNSEKVIIFTSFLNMSDLICKNVEEKYNIKCWKIDGRTPVSERQSIIDIFSSQNSTACLVLNPKAAGTGLNITAANHVIHYNLEWNPAVEDQASSRAYRRGQTLPVTVHRLFYPDTIEEVIYDRIEQKRDLAEAAVIGTDSCSISSADIARALAMSPVVYGAVSE